MKRITQRAVWYFRQLFPLIYWTKFVNDNKRKICIWKMWLGRSYKINTFVLADEQEN